MLYSIFPTTHLTETVVVGPGYACLHVRDLYYNLPELLRVDISWAHALKMDTIPSMAKNDAADLEQSYRGHESGPLVPVRTKRHAYLNQPNR